MSSVDLRKKAIAAEHANAHSHTVGVPADSVVSSGATTPTGMAKNDSILNLTKPSLYGIYNENEDSFLNLSKDDMNMYVTPPSLKHANVLEGEEDDDVEDDDAADAGPTKNSTSQKGAGASPTSLEHQNQVHPSMVYTIFKTAAKIALLTIACFLYNQVTENLNNNHVDLVTSSITVRPLQITNSALGKFLEKLQPVPESVTVADEENLGWINYTFALVLQGSAMGLIVPIMDSILPSALSTRLLSLAPKSAHYNPKHPSKKNLKSIRNPSSPSNLTNEIVRSLITFVGLLYAVRKVQWTSALQMLLLWSVLNPCLWLLLDGTVSGFISSTLAALGACVAVYFQSYDIVSSQSQEDFIAIWLLLASFFFCGLIIFGKLGRALFGN